MDLLTQVPIGIIRVFHLNSSDGRKDMHNYLNNFHPKLKHVGLLCKCFPFDDKTYFKCYNCKSLILLEYHRGIENNNIDESMSGICENCDESIHWEPNFDSRSRVRYIEHHNVIAISDWFKGYTTLHHIIKIWKKIKSLLQRLRKYCQKSIITISKFLLLA